MNTSLKQGITLALFSSLIIGFVSYKSGILGGAGPNSYAANASIDPEDYNRSFEREEMMSSSKSTIVYHGGVLDSPIIKNRADSTDSMRSSHPREDSIGRRKIMWSSKSRPIFSGDEGIFATPQVDSLTGDSVSARLDSIVLDSQIIND